jgi:hypothetical protein
MEKTKTVYWVERKGADGYSYSQYLLPNELHLIKTMLKDGGTICLIRKDQLTLAEYKVLFG